MTQNKFQQFCNDFAFELKKALPKSAESYSVKLRRTNKDTCEICVSNENNENQNQETDAWFDKIVSQIVAGLSSKYGGTKND